MAARVSRRDFLKTSAVAGAAATAIGASAQAASASEKGDEPFEASIDWAAEFDAVVIGSGFAGLVAASAAAEAGQKVLIVEKAPYALRGGNSRVTAGYILDCDPDNKEGLVNYCRGLAGMYDTPASDVLEAYADAVVTIPDWLNERGGTITELEGDGLARKDVEGWEAVKFYCNDGNFYNAGIYNPLIAYVESLDNVEIWYDAPATKLIQDPATKIIHGVEVTVDGTVYAVRARDGVALCAGGFSANKTMVQDYLPFPYACYLGSSYDTGDGIKMATEVGADLWHMRAMDGPDLNVMNPVTGAAFTGGSIRFRGYSPDVRESSGFTCNSVIMVGSDGTRFCDEATAPDHGFENFHGRLIYVTMPLPAYMIFDAAAFEKPIYPVWHTNDEQLEDGVIVSADTIEELAEKINIDPEALSQTVEAYNDYCANGEDPDYGRSAEYLTALSESGPYYACEFAPSIVNTQGGPKRDAQARILDVHGDPIPHLYGAGECGAMWSDVYPGGGNIGEALSYGLIAGQALGEKKDDVSADSVMNGKDPVSFTYDAPAFEAEADNEYIGMSRGIGGPIWVKVTVDGDSWDLEVLSNNETPNIGSKAIEALPSEMVDAQSADVDVYTGATATSNALIAAVKDALTQAGLA